MSASKGFIYRTKEIRHIETLAQEKYSISSFVMMHRAAKAAFDFLLKRWPKAQRILVYCGSGNNGGDGYIIARLACERGLRVLIRQVGNPEKLQESAKDAMVSCQQAEIPFHSLEDEITFSPDVIVDAICGIGLKEALHGDALVAMQQINQAKALVLAIDVPSGLDADTGNVCGEAVKATATITFIGWKIGLLTGQGLNYCGEVICDDLQLPQALLKEATPIAEKISPQAYKQFLAPRPRDWHKGKSGFVLILGGAPGFSGAPMLAAIAALRVGAGLVSIATDPDHAAFMNVNFPEVMCHGIDGASQLNDLMARAKVIVLGPGLATTSWSKMIFNATLQQQKPFIVDADGLNLLAEQSSMRNDWILTPHPGEAARLLHCTVDEIQQDRLQAASLIQKKYGGTCVLKGAGTLVLSQEHLPALCMHGNPGMATAGMGDMLSGVIAGLHAQQISQHAAAALGVYLHAAAGDLAAKNGERGMIATDLLPYLRRLCNPNQL